VGNSFTPLRFERKDKAILVLQYDVMMTRGRLEVNLHEFLKSVLNATPLSRRLSAVKSSTDCREISRHRICALELYAVRIIREIMLRRMSWAVP
jgi:hypothetical protein